MENDELIEVIDDLREENEYLRDTLIVALVKLSKYQQEEIDGYDKYFAGFGNRSN
jgi:hypothetical protein